MFVSIQQKEVIKSESKMQEDNLGTFHCEGEELVRKIVKKIIAESAEELGNDIVIYSHGGNKITITSREPKEVFDDPDHGACAVYPLIDIVIDSDEVVNIDEMIEGFRDLLR